VDETHRNPMNKHREGRREQQSNHQQYRSAQLFVVLPHTMTDGTQFTVTSFQYLDT
jgi:hypothetical protein